MYRFVLAFAVFGVVSCASVPVADHAVFCETEIAQMDVDFDGAAAASCEADGNVFTLQISPEDTPINPSPWYAVRFTPRVAGEVVLVLDYAAEGWHRYHPKISADRINWTDLDEDRVDVSDDESEARIRVPLDVAPVYVVGQELYTAEDYNAWMTELINLSSVTERVIGHSIDGRPIQALRHDAVAHDAKTIFLVGRQHPPEVTGGFAMKRFVAELFSDSVVAREFRKRFNIVMVPLMNPDGVADGYWRHNKGGVDLNRDWGPFAQPETQAVKTLLDEMAGNPEEELAVFLDFHSTWRNVFYTQTAEDEPTAYNFTGKWIAAGRASLPEYDAEYSANEVTVFTTSKHYIHTRFSVPSITYEVGDETDRDLIDASAAVYADEMMQLLLQYE